MDTLFEIDDRHALLDQVRSRQRRRRRVGALTSAPASGLRFAFYARTSTAEYQDPVTSRAWQREVAESVIDGHGAITAEFMDIGWSREVGWAQRPQAAALLAASGRSMVQGDAVVSKVVSHPALVSEEDFVAAQQIRAERSVGMGGQRHYVLRGLVRCGLCGRRMNAHWVHRRAGYRCRHGHRSNGSRSADALDNLYIREDVLLGRLTAHVLPGRDPAAGPATVQDVGEYLRANKLVVDVFSPTRWALTDDV
jgi:Recombinase zinc beta ribbon domain